MPAKYVGKGGGQEADRSTSRASCPTSTAFVARVLDEAGIPPVPEDTSPRVRKAAGSTSMPRVPAKWR